MGKKKTFYTNRNQKRATVATPEKTDSVMRDTEEHYIMVKGSHPVRGYNICKYLCIQHRSA